MGLLQGEKAILHIPIACQRTHHRQVPPHSTILMKFHATRTTLLLPTLFKVYKILHTIHEKNSLQELFLRHNLPNLLRLTPPSHSSPWPELAWIILRLLLQTPVRQKRRSEVKDSNGRT